MSPNEPTDAKEVKGAKAFGGGSASESEALCRAVAGKTKLQSR